MAIRVGINGFGRIGRTVFRVLASRPSIEVVAINDITKPDVLAHLLKYDTVMGRFDKAVAVESQKRQLDGKEVTESFLVVGGKRTRILEVKDPAQLPWKDLKVDIVVESTGVFDKRADVEKHVQAGARRVLLTLPPKDAIDNMVVLGVNDDTITPEQKLISNASCTTNCLAPIARILDEEFGIDHGIMTTVHAYTNDQRVADLPHKDLRRARSAAQNIIPTSTGAARAVGKVLPRLAGKLDGIALRVPVIDGSIVDLTAELKKDVTAREINAAVKKWAEGKLKGIIEYTEDEIVSSDIIGNPHSAIFDAKATMVLGKEDPQTKERRGRSVKVFAWYDNEWGYSTRVCDLIEKLAS
jgi:glyceraldehyde 3-phosphate dehydrogenase